MFCWVEQPHFIHVIICLFLFDTDHPFGKAFHSIMLYDHLTRDSQAPVQPRHGHTSRDSIRYLLGSDAKKIRTLGWSWTFSLTTLSQERWMHGKWPPSFLRSFSRISLPSTVSWGLVLEYHIPSPLWKRMEKACVFWMTASSFFCWTVAFRNSVLAIACAMVELRYHPLSDLWVVLLGCPDTRVRFMCPCAIPAVLLPFTLYLVPT